MMKDSLKIDFPLTSLNYKGTREELDRILREFVGGTVTNALVTPGGIIYLELTKP